MTISIQFAVVFGLVLLASMILNGILIWYARASIMQLAFVSENVNALKDSIGAYEAHLKSVYELDMFYGDETLGALMKHTTDLHESMAVYEEFYDLFLQDTEEDEAAEIITQEEDAYAAQEKE